MKKTPELKNFIVHKNKLFVKKLTEVNLQEYVSGLF